MSEKTTNVFRSISINEESEGLIEINSNGWIKATFHNSEDSILISLSTDQMKAIARFLNSVASGQCHSIQIKTGGAE